MDQDALPLDTDELVRRVSRRYRPGAWIGGVRKVFGSVTELAASPDGGDEFETHPPHFLVALWKPLSPQDTPLLARWPYKVSIVVPDPAAALADLLIEVPDGDRLWLASEQVDWGLMAAIVMLSEPGLQPYEYRELQEFVRAEQQAVLAAISVNYSGGDEVFKQFARTSPGALE
jgi:hypothetical protein